MLAIDENNLSMIEQKLKELKKNIRNLDKKKAVLIYSKEQL